VNEFTITLTPESVRLKRKKTEPMEYNMNSPKLYKNFINGEWVESSSNKTYENRNPANTDEAVSYTHLTLPTILRV